ncbi:MAG: poly(A) polymerase PcnB, partial [Pseudomonadota bacterium]
FDFLRLRADVDEVPPELAEWWEDYSLGSDEEREALLAAVRAQPGPKRVRSVRADSGPAVAASGGRTGRGAPSRSRSSSAQGVADDAGSAADQDGDPSTDGSADASDAPRKRRRRRRRPGGTGGTGGTGDGTPQA